MWRNKNTIRRLNRDRGEAKRRQSYVPLMARAGIYQLESTHVPYFCRERFYSDHESLFLIVRDQRRSCVCFIRVVEAASELLSFVISKNNHCNDNNNKSIRNLRIDSRLKCVIFRFVQKYIRD